MTSQIITMAPSHIETKSLELQGSVNADRIKKTNPKRGKLRSRAKTAVQLCKLLVGNGRWWLTPFLGVLGVTALLLAAVTVFEYVAPFVYTIF
jgi:hypothetical protein